MSAAQKHEEEVRADLVMRCAFACASGWYEWNRYEETHWRVDVPVTHWMPLPLPFNAGIERR